MAKKTEIGMCMNIISTYQEAEKRAQTIRVAEVLESISDAFFLLDRNWRFTYLNKQAVILLYKKKDDLLNRSIWDEFPEALDSVFYEKYQKVIEQKTAQHFEEYFTPLNTWYEVHAYPAEEGIAVYFTNVNHRKKTEQKLKESEEQYRTLFETMPQGVIYYDSKGKIKEMNPAAEKILGRNILEIKSDAFKSEMKPTLNENMLPFPDSYDPIDIALTTCERIQNITMGIYNPKDKNYRWVVLSAIPQIKLGGDGPYQVYATLEDITNERKARNELFLTQNQLKSSEKNFRNLAETIPQLVWISDSTGEVQYFNKRWYDFTKVDESTISMKNWWEQLHPDDRQRAVEYWENSVETGQQYEIEYRIRNGETDEYCWFLARALPIASERGKITKWFGTCTNIDDHKKIIENEKFLSDASKILSSSLDFNTTLQKTADVAVSHIADWCSVDLKNGKHIDLVAVSHKDPEKINWARELRKNNPPRLDEDKGLAKVLKTGEIEYYPYISDELLEASAKDEEELRILREIGFYSVIIVPLQIQNKTIGAITLVSTESKRKFSNHDVLTAEELAKRASLAIQNSQLYEKAQLRESQFKALYNSNVIGVIYCDLNGKIYEANNAFLQMVGYSKKDLEKGLLDWNKITPPDYKEADENALSELMSLGYANTWEKEYIKSDGSQVPVIVGAAMLNKESTETIAFVLDITERRKLEQRKDEFIGIASHELKTPLTSIKGYTQILERIIHQMSDERAKIYLKKTNTYIDRLNSLIADLLDVSKIQAGKLQMNFSEFSVDDLVDDGIESIQHINSQHEISKTGVASERVLGDKHRLEQVFTNLLSNAIKYSPDANKIEVHISKNDSMITVSIKDYGVGIAEENLHKLFERFYRVEETAKTFSGLGIGLYISSEIVRRHGGDIWVESEHGNGSTFYFTLPIAKGN